MSDVHSPEQRRTNMRAIRNKNTSPELQVRRMLFAQGFRFRLHVKEIVGSPDVVLPKHRVVVFIHGCFWHGHGCYLFKVPKTRQDFWLGKISANKQRDARQRESLIGAGWRVLVIWECALKGKLRQPVDSVQKTMKTWILGGESLSTELEIECIQFDDLRPASLIEV